MSSVKTAELIAFWWDLDLLLESGVFGEPESADHLSRIDSVKGVLDLSRAWLDLLDLGMFGSASEGVEERFLRKSGFSFFSAGCR